LRLKIHPEMRLLLVLSLVFASARVSAQQSVATSLPAPIGRTPGPSSAELRDCWPGIAEATNDWALAIRRSGDWTNVSGASLSKAESLARASNGLAQLRMGYSYLVGEEVNRDFSAAVRWLRPAGEAHLAPAEFLLGVALLNGWGAPPDFEVAIDHFEQAANQGFAAAQFQLGLCFLKGGPNVNQAPARGVKWVTRAAEQGKAAAQQFLAWCFASGTGVSEDPSEAYRWCARAANQGLDSAQDFLGMFCAVGYGTNQDWTEAARCFEKAAKQGLGTAQIHLAQCYGRGRGVPMDPGQSLHWWYAAAEQGYPTASFHSGLALLNGTGTNRNPEAAVKWFRKAAEQQHIGAELYLGLCFWKGMGVATDLDSAQKWWRDAAIHGIAVRMAELGDDPSDVEKWWQEVAEQANARLQCCLAEFYHSGQGVAQSDARALTWYRKASAAGDPSALRAAAWLLATSPKSEVRDGHAAVELARRATAAKRKDPKALDTLAAAYAEAAQFNKAINTENEAIALTQEDEDKRDFLSRLKLYQAKMPFRELPDLIKPPLE
jgi:uncharacterized protein